MAKNVEMKQVDVTGLMSALKTTGKAKLSDFATPVEKLIDDPKPNVLKQYAEQKRKMPDAMLLFRHKEFYELFNADAKAAAPLLGIRCVGFRNDPDTCMSVFNHTKLDIYLPKLIRAGYRVAICDVAISDDNSNDKKNQEDENMRLNLNANNNESMNVQSAAPVANPVEDAVAEEIKDVDVQEVSDIRPTVVKAAVKAAGGGDATTIPLSDRGTLVVGGVPKPNGKPAPKKSEPKPDPEAVGELSGMLTKVEMVVYKTKKGADAPMIVGFSGEDDPRWKKHHEAKPKWVSAGYRTTDDGSKRYHLIFGSRYMEVAKALCDAYNTADKAAWAKAEKACAGNYDTIVGGFKAEREAKRAERKAQRDAGKAAKAETANKTYTNEDVAAMLRKVMAGGNIPEDIEKLLKVA